MRVFWEQLEPQATHLPAEMAASVGLGLSQRAKTTHYCETAQAKLNV